MKKIIFYLFFLSLVLGLAKHASAQEVILGRFSPLDLERTFSNDLQLKVKNFSYTLSGKELKNWTTEKEDLIFNPLYQSELETGDICAYQKSIACSLLFPYKNFSHIQKISAAYIDSDLIKKFIDDLARKVDKDPANALLKIEGEKATAFSLEKKGLLLDREKSFEVILKNLKEISNRALVVDLPFTEIEPEISSGSVDTLGINSLIGEGRSNFKGSPKNRVFNIKVATSRYNGILIKPGEEFSFVEILGEVDSEHGYLPELVIKKDKTEPEFGGGICQVSTTVFRAAIYSGLEITARKNHSYPVQYYNPQGLDATVYVPRPDLKFINNTPGYILIQTKIEGTELIFQFYGTDDGRKVEIDGPRIIKKNPDGSMKTTFTQKVFDKNSDIILEDVFNSNYDSPANYPHPEEEPTTKPENWSKKQWEAYKKTANP
ncbi:MAG: hypothetical protein COU40_02820 [Candidatus Moranbacteria bacterium CG10_big_fil_rev_8_21_14_0_10_35_21]|nr:MAG: hypothetical protein COU40_02820 [Candidatus Moranbacteria bacterium CG10_big_fil_rev_8_21_14_0_10_35_21]